MTARGEGYLTVKGEQVPILLTNRALAQAEGTSGKPLPQLAREAGDGRTGMNDLACLLQAGMEAARRDAGANGRPHTLDDAYDVLDQVGFTTALQVVLDGLAAVISYKGETGATADPPVAEHGTGKAS